MTHNCFTCRVLLSIDEIRLLYIKHAFRAPIEERIKKMTILINDLTLDLKHITSFTVRQSALDNLEIYKKNNIDDKMILNKLKESRLFDKLFYIRESCHKNGYLNINADDLIDLFNINKTDQSLIGKLFSSFTLKKMEIVNIDKILISWKELPDVILRYENDHILKDVMLTYYKSIDINYKLLEDHIPVKEIFY